MYRIQDPANCVRSFRQMRISQLLKDRVEIRPKFPRNGGPAVVSGKPCRRTSQSCVSQECKHVWEKVRCISDFARIFDVDSGSGDHMCLLQDPANCVHSFLQMLISQLLKDRGEIHPKFRRNGGPAVVSGKPCRRTRPELRLAGVSTCLGESAMHFVFCADL